MPKRVIFLWAVPLLVGTSLYAQTQDTPPPPERTLWDHNGSTMYLVASGSSRELHYQKPRSGMLEAGAHPDDVLFKSDISDGQLTGTAYIFNAQCGQAPFHVKGSVLDNGGKIVLTGLAPRIGRNCQSYGEYTSTLEFKLLKTAEVTQPSSMAAPNEEQTREQSASDAAEPNLSNNSSAQPVQTIQTPSPDAGAKLPPIGTVDANLRGKLSAETTPTTVQPNLVEGPKLATDAKTATNPSERRSPATSTPASAQDVEKKGLLAPTIIVLNATLPFLSILLLIMMVRPNGTRRGLRGQ